MSTVRAMIASALMSSGDNRGDALPLLLDLRIGDAAAPGSVQ